MKDMKRPRTPRRYCRNSTKRRLSLRNIRHPGRVLACLIGTLAVIITALLWGNHLRKQSESFRDSAHVEDWTVDESIKPIHPVAVPAVRAVEIFPEGNTGDILIAGQHGGIVLPLCEGLLTDKATATYLFESSVSALAGLPVTQEAPRLSDEILRITRRGFHLTFRYTLSFPAAVDTASETYLYGLELSLLYEAVTSGAGDLLLALPSPEEIDTASLSREKTDAMLQKALAFIKELKQMTADLASPPAIGLLLPLTILSDNEAPPLDEPWREYAESEAPSAASSYIGSLQVGRLLAVTDYLAIDLRGLSTDALEDALSRLAFSYVRYSLRLAIAKNEPSLSEVVIQHGFSRLFEIS